MRARSVSAIIAALIISATPYSALAQVSIGVGVGFGGPGWGVGVAADYGPPVLPVYSQPPAPYPAWQWIPGYWGWGSYGYYWVPGYWTAPPVIGYYWTPGYWGYLNGGYVWNAGYWGPTVGFYGGINYGFGYFGTGFVGGYWAGSAFNYNTAVVNVNRTVIHNTYNKTVIHNAAGRSDPSFNGGRGGVHARPTHAQLAARRHAIGETAAQRTHERLAAQNHSLRASVNHGEPRLAAVQRPLRATHGRMSAPVHRNAAVAAHHHASVATAHHATVATTHHETNVAAAHHNAPVTSVHHNAPVLTTHHSNAMTYRNPSPTFHQAPHPQAGAFAGHPAGGHSPSGGSMHGRPPRG